MRRKDHASVNDIEFFQDTRLSVIDERSFAVYHSVLFKIRNNLKEFTECQKYIYGKHAISCFLGDFCQFEAIGGDCIYKNRNGIYWEQALICMVELKGTHCCNDCNDMKMIMPICEMVFCLQKNGVHLFPCHQWERSQENKTVKNQICHI
jgi:hypothetical protein